MKGLGAARPRPPMGQGRGAGTPREGPPRKRASEAGGPPSPEPMVGFQPAALVTGSPPLARGVRGPWLGGLMQRHLHMEWIRLATE
jgi:hypothetical protein